MITGPDATKADVAAFLDQSASLRRRHHRGNPKPGQVGIVTAVDLRRLTPSQK